MLKTETEVFIADLIACSTCVGHHYAHHQELNSFIQWLLPFYFHILTTMHGQNHIKLIVIFTVRAPYFLRASTIFTPFPCRLSSCIQNCFLCHLCRSKHSHCNDVVAARGATRRCFRGSLEPSPGCSQPYKNYSG